MKWLIALLILIVAAAAVTWFVIQNRPTATPNLPVWSLSAFNQTKNSDATKVDANLGDTIVYTLLAENQADKTIPGYVLQIDISPIGDQTTIVDASGASFDAQTKTLSWTPLDIPAHESIQKQFSVKVNSTEGFLKL